MSHEMSKLTRILFSRQEAGSCQGRHAEFKLLTLCVACRRMQYFRAGERFSDREPAERRRRERLSISRAEFPSSCFLLPVR